MKQTETKVTVKKVEAKAGYDIVLIADLALEKETLNNEFPKYAPRAPQVYMAKSLNITDFTEVIQLTEEEKNAREEKQKPLIGK